MLASNFELDPSGPASEVLQFLGHLERVRLQLVWFFREYVARSGPAEFAKALEKHFERADLDARKRYFRAAMADIEADAPVDEMIQVLVAATRLRDRIAHGHPLAVQQNGTSGPTLYLMPTHANEETGLGEAIPLRALQVQVHRLIWLERWVRWTWATNPSFGYLDEERELERQLTAATWYRPSNVPPNEPSVE